MLPDSRATAVTTFAFMLFLGQSVGALLAGFGIGLVGYRATFLVQGGLILAATAWITWLIRRAQAQPSRGAAVDERDTGTRPGRLG